MAAAMIKEDDVQQDKEWNALYQKIVHLLSRWGTEEYRGRADYLIVDDNYGWNRQTIEIHNLKMLKVEIVKELQSLLTDYPNWTIVIAVDIPGQEHWPPMGVTIRAHEIIDGLQRKYLPEQFRFLNIPGSRPGTGYD
ncbi:MAG TPA: hypothetical protein VG986_09250 [Pseudolabrys sp.]|nr:hypothetical protein [Pseudolabrys sp.]